MTNREPEAEASVRTPTRVAAVELDIEGGRKQSVTIYLSSVAQTHAGPETVEEALNHERAFMPVRDQDSGDAFLVRRSAIRLVTHLLDPSETLRRVEDAGFVDLVKLELDTGEMVEGTLATILPPDRARLSDFFNFTNAQFIPVEVADGVSYVNRDFISMVWL